MGRIQPAKALGSITSGWFPQLARRKRSPPLEIQLWRSDKIGALNHHRLRGRKRLGIAAGADAPAQTSTIQLAHGALAPLAIDQQLGAFGHNLRWWRELSALFCARHSCAL